jgi:hypothetical protein
VNSQILVGSLENFIAALDTTTGSATAWDADANGIVSNLGIVSRNSFMQVVVFSSLGANRANKKLYRCIRCDNRKYLQAGIQMRMGM